MAPTLKLPVFAEGRKRRHHNGRCKKVSTLGCHGRRRRQGKTFGKKRNQDPPGLQGLRRDCRCCGVADDASFKYYNNNSLSQPRFKRLRRGKQFQKRLLVDGHARRLVHISSKQRQLRSAWKKLSLAPSSNASNSDDDMNSPSIGVPTPMDACASTAENAPQLNDAGAQSAPGTFMDFMESSLSVDGAELLNSIKPSFSDNMNEAKAMNDVDMLSYATNANLDIAQYQTVESAPGTFMDLMESNSIDASGRDEMNEAEAVNDVDMTSAFTNVNIEVSPDQMMESAPEI